jgi:type III secretory pathway lipoprotein EscJ
MTRMVQLLVAGDGTEAEEIQTMLATAGIESELETAVEHHPAATDDSPQKVLVPEAKLEQALEVVEALSEPDELTSDA